MNKRFWCWLLLMSLAGCNLPTVAQPVETPEMVLTLTVSATRQPTFTSIPTLTPTDTSESLLASETPIPSATFTSLAPVTPATQLVESLDNGSFQESVFLNGGICCVGGVVGTKVSLRKDFIAQSPFGSVIEMRRKEGMFCYSEVEMADVPWEPFVTSVTEPYLITAINWVGHYISVQYRDSLGNLSPVVCDDISVEGMPPPPTPGL
jgi:hypothetical protein